MSQKVVDAAVCIQEGSLSHFGPSTYFGLKNVKTAFLENKIAWQEGEVFDSSLIDETQRRLLKSNLFSTVLVTYAEELDSAGGLPMKIRVSEGKYKTFSVGAFYGTVDGPGLIVGWKDRNLRGMGEELKFEVQGSLYTDIGMISYSKPDFGAIDQTLTLLGEASYENINPYLAKTLLASGRLQREFDARHLGSIGLQVEAIQISQSANNGSFALVGLPIFARYAWVDSPLDPNKGWQLAYTAVPYQSLQSATHFVKQHLQLNFYFPMSQRAVFAIHSLFGSVAGAQQKQIPMTKLFLGGSEDDLRGYEYMTVSPLDKKGNPLGGRSAIFATLEIRLRVHQILGLVPFFDLGTVSLNELPQVDTKWFKSVGLGLRYYTFFGPLRLDYGYPLDRRKGLDTRWGNLYASMGQSF